MERMFLTIMRVSRIPLRSEAIVIRIEGLLCNNKADRDAKVADCFPSSHGLK